MTKQVTRHILLATVFTATGWSNPEAGEQDPGKPVLAITPFTLTSSEGHLDFRMDEGGKLLIEGEHIGTVHPDGRLIVAEGGFVVRLNEKGIVVNDQGQPAKDPVEIPEDGTWKNGGETGDDLKWVDGVMELGHGFSWTITPKDSPSQRVATFTIMAMMGHLTGSVTLVQEFGPHTLQVLPHPRVSGTDTGDDDSITFMADEDKFELKDGEFSLNGKNYGKLPEGSEISFLDGVLTINGKVLDGQN